MRKHSLLASDFVDIARGRGNSNAMDQLRGGQLSKHVLLLLGILKHARQECPELYPQIEDAYALLRTAQAADRVAVNELLGHPHVGMWAARCLRRLRGDLQDDSSPLTADLSQLGAVAAVAAFRAGCSFTAATSLRKGVVALPTLGAAHFPGADPWASATITHDGERIRVRTGEQTVLLPDDPLGDAPNWFAVRHLRSEYRSEPLVVELADVTASTDGSERGVTSRISRSDLARWQELFDEAWRTIVRHHPAHTRALRAGLVSIVPVDQNGSINSMSSSDAFGVVITKLPEDGFLLAETLIHEFHHSKLNALMDLVPLHDEDEEAQYYAPWRADPRPLRGLLHGTYAFLGITEFWRLQREVLRDPQRQFADFTFVRWREQVTTAIEVLRRSGHLTDRGQEFVSHMRAVAKQWRGVDIDEDAPPRRLADQATLEHRIRWRLAHLRPEPEAIAVIAAAWRAGEPCPMDVGLVPVELAPGTATQADNVLGTLMRLRIRQADRFAAQCADPNQLVASGLDVVDADIAFLRDDFPVAVQRYHAEVEANSDNTNRWVGLTLATASAAGEHGNALLAAPEVVREVYHRIRAEEETDLGLDKLLAWLDSARPATISAGEPGGLLDVLRL